MIRLGLTGSIAMGKSATASIFKSLGVPVHDADATVHQLMSSKGEAFGKIIKIFPDVLTDGEIDRQKLGGHVFGKSDALKKLENILHPLVRKAEQKFIQHCHRRKVKICVMDIPLLFETNGEKRMDAVCVVSSSFLLQRKRAMARSGMTEEKLKSILARQLPDFQKRKRADFVIHTGSGFRNARNQVKKILKSLRQES